MTDPMETLQNKQDDIAKESSQDQKIINSLNVKYKEFIDADMQTKIGLLTEIMAKNNITVDDLLDMADR